MTFTEDEVCEIVRQLDRPCWSCGGTGAGTAAIRRDDTDKCAICDGCGYTLTTAGTALLEFIGRHGQERP
jgi:DnaJ-class molecular chaperone